MTSRRLGRLRSTGVIVITIAIVVTGCGKKGGGGAAGGAGAASEFVVSDPALVARNNRGVGLMGRFEYTEAEKIFAALAAEHPDWLEVKVNAAIAALNRQQEGDEQAALDRLSAVLTVAPDHLRANYCVGLLLSRAGRTEEALVRFRRVAEADPHDAYAAYFVGQCSEIVDPETALRWYRHALERDPYLRSGSYRAFQMLQRLGRREEAQAYLDDFQRLEKNPRARIVEIVYTKMGPKAEVVAVDLAETRELRPPTGPIFAEAEPLLSVDLAWRGAGGRGPSVTVCDLDADGRLDVFFADALREDGGVVNALLIGTDDGRFEVDLDHPLATIAGVNAVLWGDWDNDGLTDAYLCRRGPNQLWRQHEDGPWLDVTAETGTAGADLDTVDGVMVDADHDGDLDIVLANADGPNELFNNDLDGTFRAIGVELGLAGGNRESRQVIAADIDCDRDLDLVFINFTPPHFVFRNDRLWRYERVEGLSEFQGLEVDAAVVGDLDADGLPEIVTRRDGEPPVVHDLRAEGGVARASLALETGRAPGRDIAIADVIGTGIRHLLFWTGNGWWIGDANDAGSNPGSGHAPTTLAAWSLLAGDPARGPSIVGLPENGPPLIWRHGPGRHAFASLALSGKTDDAKSMRSNASGIGARVAVRVDSRWTIASTLDASSGRGQSLQPLAVGLGDARKIDFVALDWSDGTYQSELDLAAGALHAIDETQRQVSSCPVLFAWNGRGFEFVSDVLGVGGIGFLLTPEEFSTPRPTERFLLPAGLLAPLGGRYVLQVTEPMEEACYLDAARLLTVDLPPGWSVVPDERMSVLGPAPTGALLFFRDEIEPGAATNDRGDDVSSLVRDADGRAAPVGALDRRFIGRLALPHTLTLEFPDAIDAGRGEPVLVVDGWVEYPYSQTMFAAWQADAAYHAPTLEARGDDGVWRVVAEQFGYPAGMPRRMALPLPPLPPGTRSLRLTTNQEVYWDRIAVVFAEPCPETRIVVTEAAHASLERLGFPARTTNDQRRPDYDFSRTRPLWDMRHMAGWYTRFGPVTDLLAETDDAVAIFGPGEGVRVEFAAAAAALPAGWTRRHVLEINGWCKDMDLYTRTGETIAPLPMTGPGSTRRDDLHRRYNTRYASGQ